MQSEQTVGNSSGVIRSRLRGEDQGDLAWFFVEGAVAFDKSPLGAMLERAELFTFGPMVCPGCNGEGYRGDPEKKILEAIDAAKKLEAELAARGESFASNLRKWRTEHGKERPPWYDDGQCRVCNGCGWLPRTIKLNEDTWAKKVTAWAWGPSVDENGHRTYRLSSDDETEYARPTGSSIKKMAGREPPGEMLERYGLVSRKLSRVSDDHRATLEAFFGLAGLRWAEDRYRGRIWGVMPLTPAGKKLIKQSRKKADGAMVTDDQVLNVEAELQKGKPMKTRGALLEEARNQAIERLHRAEDAWGAGRDGMDPVASAEKTLGRIRASLKRMVA